jgi:hypothetical protein
MSPVPAKGAPLGAGVSKEGDVADPRGGDESARRSVEEKVVGLMEEEAVWCMGMALLQESLPIVDLRNVVAFLAVRGQDAS